MVSRASAIVLAAACALVSSALTAWAVWQFSAPHAEPQLSSSPASDPVPPSLHAAGGDLQPATHPMEIVLGDTEAFYERPPAPMPRSDPLSVQIVGTAATTHELIGSLQAQYNNAYFSNRTGLKNDLNAVQAAAQALANGEATAQGASTLGAALDRTISRLDNLIQSTKDENQVEASRALKAKLEELRATLPANGPPG
jgi:hypothetical protein